MSDKPSGSDVQKRPPNNNLIFAGVILLIIIIAAAFALLKPSEAPKTVMQVEEPVKNNLLWS